MSEHIPEYIGSKLGAFHDEDVVLEVDSAHPDESVEQLDQSISQVIPPPKENKPMVNKRKKPPTGKNKRSRKKTGEGAVKSLPINPGATQSVELDIPPVPVAELPDIESFAAPALDAELEQKEVSLADDLKSLSGKKKPRAKKKAIKKPARSVKPDKTEKVEDAASKLDELIAEQVVEEVNMPMPPAPKAKNTEKIKSKPKAKKKQQVAKAKETNETLLESSTKPLEAPSSSSDEIEHRRAYVQRLKSETHSFLKQLAKEREERVKSLERLRTEIREQLAKK